MAYRSKVKKNIEILRGTARTIIMDRMEAMQSGQHTPHDILAYIVKMAEAGVPMETLVDHFTTIFMAGQETTTTTMSFLLLEAGRHPEVLKRLQAEVDDVLGERPYVTYDDVGRLEYMGQALKEALRLYPPVPVTSRESSEPTEVGGYMVPPRTMILVSMFSSQRIGGDLTFNPDNFAKDKTKPNVYTYYPFSLGPRICIGQTFAKIQAKVILAKLIQRFNMTVDLNQSFDMIQYSTIHPKGGVMCTLAARDGA